MAQNKLIVKNTIFMYTRMILIMGVTLYASRVVLDKLGVQDFSLYNVVGGIVGMLSFLNGTLSTGTSRFITYELGTKDENRLLQTYRTSVFAHLLLGSLESGLDFCLKLVGISATELVVFCAALGRDCESCRNRHTQLAHFSKIGALTTEQLTHGAVALGGLSAETVNAFFHFKHRKNSSLLYIVIFLP